MQAEILQNINEYLSFAIDFSSIPEKKFIIIKVHTSPK